MRHMSAAIALVNKTPHVNRPVVVIAHGMTIDSPTGTMKMINRIGAVHPTGSKED